MFKQILTISAAAAAMQLFANAAQTSWTFPADADKWSSTRNVSVEKTEDAIALLPVKGDPSIGILKTVIDPAGLNTLRIYYRAEGFKAKRTDGQLYFGTQASPKLARMRCFILPTLITDGTPQVMTLDLSRQRAYPEWSNAKLITQLRLDMADQYPGDVYISKIEFLKRETTTDKLVWDFADGIGEWDFPENLKISWKNNMLLYETTKQDSRIVNKTSRFAGKNYTKIRVVYRAENLPKRTTGQIFFTSDKSPKYEWKRRRILPSLIADGKTHEFTVKAPWGDEEVNCIRLDLIDQHPGKVWLERIEFIK